MARRLRLKATGELATWDACDAMGKGIRIALESEGRLDLREWLNTRAWEAHR